MTVTIVVMVLAVYGSFILSRPRRHWEAGWKPTFKGFDLVKIWAKYAEI